MNFHRSFIVAFFMVTSSTTLLVARPLRTSKPNKQLSRYQKIKREISDYFGVEALGYEGIQPEYETFIRSVQDELGMSSYNIEIRSISNFAQHWLRGKMKHAFALPSINPKTQLNLLFINNEWFATLSNNEKRDVAGRQLMYIKKKIFNKKLLANIFSLCFWVLPQVYSLQVATSNAPIFGIYNDYSRNRALAEAGVLLSGWTIFVFGHLTSLLWYERKLQRTINNATQHALKNADGAVRLTENYLRHSKDPQSRFATKRFIANTLYALSAPVRLLGKAFAIEPDLEFEQLPQAKILAYDQLIKKS